MKQGKALFATIALSFALVAGVLVYGCDHSGGTGEGHEHMHVGEHGGRAGQTNGKAAPDEMEPSGTVEDGVRVVDVKARKFEFEPETIVVRQGENVRLQVTSEDVMHGIGLEAFDVNQKLPPKETKTVEFTADKAGKHHFHCSVYCGAGHDQMHGTLIVLETEEEEGDSE